MNPNLIFLYYYFFGGGHGGGEGGLEQVNFLQRIQI